LPRLGPFNTKVALDHSFAVTGNLNNSERTNDKAILAADTPVFFNQHRPIGFLSMYRCCRANHNTRRILTVPALQWHCKFSCRLHRNSSLRLRRFLRRFLKNFGPRMHYCTCYFTAFAGQAFFDIYHYGFTHLRLRNN
jgi:hypothetical protein